MSLVRWLSPIKPLITDMVIAWYSNNDLLFLVNTGLKISGIYCFMYIVYTGLKFSGIVWLNVLKSGWWNVLDYTLQNRCSVITKKKKCKYICTTNFNLKNSYNVIAWTFQNWWKLRSQRNGIQGFRGRWV